MTGCAFVVTDGVVITKLGEEDREALVAGHGGEPFTAGAKTMRKWVRTSVASDEDIVRVLPFIHRSYEAAQGEG